MKQISTLFALLTLLAPTVLAQDAAPEDVESPEAIILAGYEAIQRAPGENYDWDRFRTLFLDEARLIPNTEQLDGSFKVLTPEGFIDWIDSQTDVGGPDDAGFVESAIHNEVFRYGDIAHVISSYSVQEWDSDEILGRGVNSFQLVHHDGRWWIVGVVWDEDYAAGPLPEPFAGK